MTKENQKEKEQNVKISKYDFINSLIETFYENNEQPKWWQFIKKKSFLKSKLKLLHDIEIIWSSFWISPMGENPTGRIVIYKKDNYYDT